MADDRRQTADSEPIPALTSRATPELPSAVRRLTSGFETRAIGLRPGAEEEWGEHNGITAALPFSHHLAAVFPPALFTTHPEFFPLIEGKRFEPAPNSVNWNPDLAREDVARHAAEVAIAAFRRDPSATSFSLGINDSVVYGDGGEARRLLRKAETLKRWNAEMGATDTGGTPVATQARGSAATARNAAPSERDFFPQATARASAALRGRDDRISAFQHFSFSAFQPAAAASPPAGWFRGRPDLSPVVFTFMNRAAGIVAQAFPDKYLGCLAYYWCENAPPFPVDPHVIPFLCADRSQFYDPAFRREEFLLQERWGKALGAGNAETLKRWNAEMGSPKQPKERAGKAVPSDSDSLPMLYRANATVCQTEKLKSDDRTSMPVLSSGNTASSISEFSPKLKRSFTQSEVRRRGSEVGNFSVSAFQRFSISSEAPPRRLGLYDYLDGYGFLVPRVPIHAFAENLKHAHEVGFTDYYGESTRNWGLDGPLPWVIAQLLQDPEQPLEPLLDDYYTHYFQAAAAPMRRFFDRCEEQWMRQPGPSYWLKYYRSQSQADLFPSPVCAELRRLLDDAAARANNDRVRQRVAFVSDAFGLTERFVAFEESRGALARLVLAPPSRGKAVLCAGGRSSRLSVNGYWANRGAADVGRQTADGGSAETADGRRRMAEARASAALPQPTAEGARQTAESEPIPALTSRATPELLSAVRRLTSGSGDLAALLAEYRRRRVEFIRYSFELARRQPLAFYPLNYADWLRDDPAYAAEVAIGSRRKAEGGRPKPEAGGRTADGGRQTAEVAQTAEGRGQRAEARASAALPQPTADGRGQRAAAAQTAEGRGQTAESEPIPALTSRATPELLSAIRRLTSGSSAQRTPLPFSGPLRPARRMLGLAYGIDLPAPWLSSVEPRENGIAELRTDGGTSAETAEGRRQRAAVEIPTTEGGGQRAEARASAALPQPTAEGARQTAEAEPIPALTSRATPELLSDVRRLTSGLSDVRRPPSGTDAPRQYVHLSGQEIATFYQWRRAVPGRFYAISARVRGRVRSADAEMITLAWLDAQQRPIGTPVAMRLPTGEWPDWVTLRQGQRAPTNAAWLGVAFYAQHQVADDFVDVGDVALEADDSKAENLKR